MNAIAISAGHGKKIRGAADIIDEVDEARRVCTQLAKDLRDRLDVTVRGPYFDDVSETQDENLERIVDWHNAQERALDVSIHFNAYEHTDDPMGSECCYLTQQELAARIAEAIAGTAGLINRGPKLREDLYFLNNTEQPAVLVEVCFVDSSADVAAYQRNFGPICGVLARTLAVAVKPSEISRV